MRSAQERVLFIAAAGLTVLLCVLPMRLAPAWNGEMPGHRNQYEIAARSFLNGHLDLDYGGVDERLLALENPYDPVERKESGASYHWDHAFYNGKYYMYFGAVPVILLFLPYLALTGTDLTTYHATQVFTAAFVIGLFSLFFLLRRRFFKQLSLALTLLLAASFSLMSVWYAVSAPALYCTAITAGLCMEIWSLFFFIKAVYDTEMENRAILYAGIGALFGALSFGCRPTVALANVLVIPLLIAFLKRKKVTLRLAGKLVLAALPYFVIGALIMLYNYARFGNVFEFGQHYQLTVTDVRNGVSLTPGFVFRGLRYYLFFPKSVRSLLDLGALCAFPILWAPTLLLCKKEARIRMAKKMLPFWIGLNAAPLLIVMACILGSPVFYPRYRLDFYWLFGLSAYVSIGFFVETAKRRRLAEAVASVFAIAAVIMSVWLFFCPYDANYASLILK